MRFIIPRASTSLKLPENSSKLGFLTLLLSFVATLASTLAWKSTDVDFVATMGAKPLSAAYIFIAVLLVFSGVLLGFLRKTYTPERLFIRLQQLSWIALLVLWLIEMQYNISSIPLGIFTLKVLGHVYSSITPLSFWIMYDPYDPFCRISKSNYTLLLTTGYLGMASSGVVFNLIPLHGASSFIPIIGSLSFLLWLIANICHPEAAQRTLKKEPNIGATTPSNNTSATQGSLKAKKRFSRSTIFLISGSILLNSIASSSEYSIIADFETQFLASREGLDSSQSLAQFLTLFGLGNLFALISCRIWYTVRLGPFGLMSIGLLALSFAQFSGYITTFFPFLESTLLPWLHSPIVTAAISLLIIESLYPIVVQSNMMNVLSTLSIPTQRQARAIIESSAEALGLIVSAVLIESTASVLYTTAGMCISICLLSGFLLLKSRKKRFALVNNVKPERQEEARTIPMHERFASINNSPIPQTISDRLDSRRDIMAMHN